ECGQYGSGFHGVVVLFVVDVMSWIVLVRFAVLLSTAWPCAATSILLAANDYTLFGTHRLIFAWSGSRQGKNVALPGRQIQINPAGLKLVPVAIVLGFAHQISQPPPPAPKIGEGKADVTLALVAGVIDAGNHALACFILPGESDEGVAGAVPVP